MCGFVYAGKCNHSVENGIYLFVVLILPLSLLKHWHKTVVLKP